MNQSRIHAWCKKGITTHDKEVNNVGYCSTCGKRMTIERLKKLYKE